MTSPSPASLPAFVGVGGATPALADWGLLRARGPDALTFLQGQLSNDVQRLAVGDARLAAYCSAQGRMLASFILVKHSPEEIWLACSADVLAATLKRLSMFVMRAKVKLDDASTELCAVGLAGSAASQALTSAPTQAWVGSEQHQGHLICLPSAEDLPRWLWMGPRSQASAVTATLPTISAEAWRWLEVRSGVAQVVAATSNQFVPQMLNYELVGGVDFKKGCYPGQEIVARSQYLGKLKRRGFLLEGSAAMQAGQEVFWSGDPDQPAGMLALAAADGQGGASALAELKKSVTESGSLHLGSAQGPRLQLAALPYTLPADGDA